VEYERLARIEEKIDNLLDRIEDSSRNQAEKNSMFFGVANRVTILEATSRGVWKTLAALGTLCTILGASFAWLVDHPPSFSSYSPPYSTGRQEMIKPETDIYDRSFYRRPRSPSP
jgi:hypothetical protein